MGYLTVEELETHLYKEKIDIITRNDNTILEAAIDAASQEAKGYLGAFDKEFIFAQRGENRNALLLIFIKDIAVWHFINLCNAGTDLELRQDRYERAIAWLKAVQKSEITPDLPLKKTDNNQSESNEYIYGSNPKRTQHF